MTWKKLKYAHHIESIQQIENKLKDQIRKDSLKAEYKNEFKSKFK